MTRSAKPSPRALYERQGEIVEETIQENSRKRRKLTTNCVGRITIECREEGEDPIVLARPSSLHGAASQIKRNNAEGFWTDYAKIYVDGTPITTEQKDTVTGKFRPYLDQL